MKIIVLGAAGLQGRAALVYLLEQKDVTEIRAADIRDDILKEMAVRLDDERLSTRYLDLRDYEMSVQAFQGYDVVLNCALTMGGYVKTTKAALEAGANYLDLTTKGEREAQKALDHKFKEKGLVCVQNMGAGPGLTNITAAFLMDKLDQTETIDFKMISTDLVPPEEHSKPLYCNITMSDIMYLFSNPTYLYEDGVLKELEPRAIPEKFTFEEPIGTQIIAGEAHSEPICLSRSFAERGIKRISYKGSFGDEIEKKMIFLRDLGFGNRNPIEVKGQKVVPFDVLQALVENLPAEKKKEPNFVGDLIVIVTGVKEGERIEYRLRAVVPPALHKELLDRGCSGSYRAGICASVTAVMIGRGQVKIKGVVDPELAIPPDQYLNELVKFGFNIEITEKRLL